MKIIPAVAIVLLALGWATTPVHAQAKQMPPAPTEAEKKKFTQTKAKAEKGDAAAQYNLGNKYNYGRGVKQDYAQAIAWYTKAAEQNDSRAQYNLGGMHWRGEGTEKNMERCLAWWSLAAPQGHKLAKEWIPKAQAEMTRKQIVQAQVLAGKLLKK